MKQNNNTGNETYFNVVRVYNTLYHRLRIYAAFANMSMQKALNQILDEHLPKLPENISEKNHTN